MKKTLFVLLLLSIILNIGLVYFFVFRGDVVEPKDQRKAIMMSEGNREIVLGEMRDFLKNVQQINEGIIENNPEKIIKAAKTSGREVEEQIPQGLIKSLPIDFKRLGFATHDLFDELADSVRVNYQPKKTQKQLNRILNNCVTCHQIYQIKTYENK